MQSRGRYGFPLPSFVTPRDRRSREPYESFAFLTRGVDMYAVGEARPKRSPDTQGRSDSTPKGVRMLIQ